MNLKKTITSGTVVLSILGLVACTSGENAASGSASSSTPGFATSCKVTGQMVNAIEFAVSVTAAKAADVTDVDVEFMKDGAALSTQDTSYSDGGIGVLMSKMGVGIPAFLAAGQTWKYTTDPDSGDLFVPPGEYDTLSAMPDSCQVIAIATPNNPGNF